MTSFLEKLKKEEGKKEVKKRITQREKREIPEGVLQLNVDIYQTSSEIIIYAPMAGVDIENLDVVMEEENDVITIRGGKERPELPGRSEKEKWLVQECEWGSFFRQIILPKEVDSSKITARFKRGVLVLNLPFLVEKEEKKKKLKVADIG